MPQKTSDIVYGKRICALFKGPPGTGKTVAAASFPGPVLIIDCDGRISPIKKMLPNRTDIYFETFRAGYSGEFDRLMKMLNSLEDRADYKTVVLDSLTSFGRLAVDHHLETRGSAKDNKVTKLSGISKPDWPEWNYEDRAFWAVLNFCRYRIGAAHFILTAHVSEVEKVSSEDDQKIIRRRRLVTGMKMLAAEIPAYFDEVWHFEAMPGGKAGRFTVTTQNMAEDFAKTALPLPKEMEVTEPDFLWDRLTKELAKSGINLETNRQEIKQQIERK